MQEAPDLVAALAAAGAVGCRASTASDAELLADLEAVERLDRVVDGVLAGLPVPVVERRACSGGVRLLVTGTDGEPLFLSRSTRVFTAAQKKALAVAAGGRCQFPGCRVPGPFLEAHHARWWQRDHGPTDTDNGLMLCSFHHHLVHAGRPPVEVRRHRDAHWFVPRGWAGEPMPQHRAASGPPGPPPVRRPARSSPWWA